MKAELCASYLTRGRVDPERWMKRHLGLGQSWATRQRADLRGFQNILYGAQKGLGSRGI